MTRLTAALKNDFAALCLLRDELSLQATLMKADLKDRWSTLEVDFARLREHVGRAEVAAEDSAAEIEAAARKLHDALRSGYSGIRNALKS
jgi:hypothetical protein